MRCWGGILREGSDARRGGMSAGFLNRRSCRWFLAICHIVDYDHCSIVKFFGFPYDLTIMGYCVIILMYSRKIESFI